MSTVIVSGRKDECSVCALPDAALQDVNVAIWQGGTKRTRYYRADGQRAAKRHGLTIEVKTVTRHADHIESMWHKADGKQPASPGEIPVFPTDYESLVEKAAHIGYQAMDEVAKRISGGQDVETRDLVAIAKLGVDARSRQEANRIASRQPRLEFRAIFGLGAGRIELPEAEAIDVTPLEELRSEVEAERALLAGRG